MIGIKIALIVFALSVGGLFAIDAAPRVVRATRRWFAFRAVRRKHRRQRIELRRSLGR